MRVDHDGREAFTLIELLVVIAIWDFGVTEFGSDCEGAGERAQDGGAEADARVAECHGTISCGYGDVPGVERNVECGRGGRQGLYLWWRGAGWGIRRRGS